jgi:hypothetical protein
MLDSRCTRRNGGGKKREDPAYVFKNKSPFIRPYPLGVYRRHWQEVKDECLSGLTVAFAQVPESVAFGFMANVRPLMSLHAAWIMGLVCSLFGSRPALINGSTGAHAAILMGPMKVSGGGGCVGRRRKKKEAPGNTEGSRHGPPGGGGG